MCTTVLGRYIKKRPFKATSGWRSQAGFTLIEVLVAVVVLALALAAVIGGMARYADTASHLRQKTFAIWVAHNRLTEIELDPTWPAVGGSDGDVELGGTEWTWRADVSETPDPKVRRIDVSVSLEGREGELIKLSAFLSSSGRSSP